MTDGYPFVFVMNDKSVKDDVLEYALWTVEKLK
jgi:hypothetical protein